MSPVPLSEISQHSDRLSSNVALPSWVNGELGLNIERTLAMMDMGGVRSLRISAIRERQSGYRPIIAGVNPDGSAIASSLSVATEKKSYQSGQTSDEGGFNLRNSTWTDVEISISLQALEEQMESKKFSRREIESWTPTIDQSIRRGLTIESIHHLLLNHSREQLLTGVIFNVKKTITLLTISAFFVKELAPGIPTFLLASSLAWAVPFGMLTPDGIKNHGWNADGKGYRISLLPGYELDRAVILLMMSRKPLVSSVRNNE